MLQSTGRAKNRVVIKCSSMGRKHSNDVLISKMLHPVASSGSYNIHITQ